MQFFTARSLGLLLRAVTNPLLANLAEKHHSRYAEFVSLPVGTKGDALRYDSRV